MHTIAEFAALHSIKPNLIHQFIWRHNIPIVKARREIIGNCGAYMRLTSVLSPESEAWILANYRQMPQKSHTKPPEKRIKYANPRSEIMSQFERYLVTSYRKLKGQATTEQIVVGCMEEFRRGRGVVSHG